MLASLLLVFVTPPFRPLSAVYFALQFIFADCRITRVKLDKSKFKSFIEKDFGAGFIKEAAKMTTSKSAEPDEFKILPLRSLDDFVLGSARFQVRKVLSRLLIM